jgi:hypothetical protein
MKADEVALVAVFLAAGMVVGFVGWTYLGPMIAGKTATPSA